MEGPCTHCPKSLWLAVCAVWPPSARYTLVAVCSRRPCPWSPSGVVVDGTTARRAERNSPSGKTCLAPSNVPSSFQAALPKRGKAQHAIPFYQYYYSSATPTHFCPPHDRPTSLVYPPLDHPSPRTPSRPLLKRSLAALLLLRPWTLHPSPSSRRSHHPAAALTVAAVSHIQTALRRPTSLPHCGTLDWATLSC